MIPSLELVRALYGAGRLARFDAGGTAYFNNTAEGFWRSFIAALIVAPVYAAFLATLYAATEAPPPLARFAVVHVIAYVIAWVIYPVVMGGLTTLLDREGRYIAYIVAYNWTTGLQNMVLLASAFLAVSGILPENAGHVLNLLVLGYVLAFAWFIARQVLEISVAAAGGLVVLDFFLGQFLRSIADGMM